MSTCQLQLNCTCTIVGMLQYILTANWSYVATTGGRAWIVTSTENLRVSRWSSTGLTRTKARIWTNMGKDDYKTPRENLACICARFRLNYTTDGQYVHGAQWKTSVPHSSRSVVGFWWWWSISRIPGFPEGPLLPTGVELSEWVGGGYMRKTWPGGPF